MSKILLFSCLFFIAGITMASDFHRKIIWFGKVDTIENEPKGNFPHQFEGSISIDRTGHPYWFESFELNSGSADVAIENAIFEPVEDSINAVETIQNEEITFNSDIGVSAGKSFLRLTIFPFIRKNNQVEKLVSFTISITENQNKIKSANAVFPWKTSSVLASGKWVKIKTKAKGIYKITSVESTGISSYKIENLSEVD